MAQRRNCKQCGNLAYLQKGRCLNCHTPEELLAYRIKKRDRMRLTRAVQRQWPKPTGELALFETIWNTRPRKSFINGEPIRKFNVSSFAHVLPKGAYKMWKLADWNIVLLTPYQHHLQHTKGRTELEAMHKGWIKFFELQDQLKAQYNEMFKIGKPKPHGNSPTN